MVKPETQKEGYMNLYLVNNAIALAVHVLVVAAGWSYPYTFAYILPQSIDYSKVILLIAVMSYITGGYFLKPVKYSFLSVVSVALFLVLALLISILSGHNTMAYAYLALNSPITSSFYLLGWSPILATVLYFASSLFPSLLMYLGIVLRMRP